jgi:two-component system phosphate regulon sensor histidine kinase PhoR
MSPRSLLAQVLLPALAAAGCALALGLGGRAAALVALCALAAGTLLGLPLRSILLARQEASRREAEARAQEPIQRLTAEATTLAAALDGMADGVWLTDARGTITRHNDALKEMLYAGQTLVGQRPLELLRRADLQEAVMLACAEGASTRLELSLEGLRPRILSVRVTPLGKDLPGSAAVFHDLTELRRLEAIRKDFVANVSHELRTPITAVRGYAETLAAGVEDPAQAQRMVTIILRQSERLSALVEDLLELSRLESNDLELHSGPVAVADAFKRAAETVRPKAAAKGIHLEAVIPGSLSAQGDDRAVEQVLLNLLDNAVKYTPEGGRVEVTGREEGSRCFISVRDSGLGIDPKHLPRIFERFYRVDKGRSRDMGGTGLGLSIVKHVVGAMQGEVRVESEPGRGSTFTVVLPSVRDSAQPG